MKIVINIFFLLSFIISINAQNKSIVWSQEYSDRGYYSLIGESENAFFAERKYNTSLNSRDVDIELLRFDQNLELTHVAQLKDIEESSYESIATVNTPEGLAHIYYQTTKRGEHIISAQLFNHSSLQKTEIVDLAKFNIIRGSQRMIIKDSDFQFSYPLDILTSRDKTKLAIVFDQEKAGKGKRNYHQYSVIDLSNRFNILYKGDFYSDDQSKKYAFSDRHLSNSGKLTYAIKRYAKDNSTEHINKKPAYDYEIHHMTGDTVGYIYDIKVKKEYIDRLKLGTDKEDNLYIAGYIRKQPFGDIKKSFLMSLDNLGYERYTVKEEYSRRDVKSIIGKEDNELDEEFKTIDIVPADNIVYVVRQYQNKETRSSSINNTGFRNSQYNQYNRYDNYWEYDEIVVEGVGIETGEILWTAVNKREQEDDNSHSRYFISTQIELVKNDLFLIYNEREENLQRIRRKENIKRTDIPGDKTAITIAKINAKGNLQYEVLNEENYFHLPIQGTFIGKESIYFFNHHKNYKKFHVGKSSKSLLDF